jgi:site-specific DNA recombinase
MSIRAAIYARYSSHEQDGTSTIESQVRECRTYAHEHGFSVIEDAVFVDKAETGTTAEQRDQFQAMLAGARRNPKSFDVILVWKFSRFARNRGDSTLTKALLRRRGIEVISVSEPVDRDSAAGILTEAMIEAIDEFYSARLAEEVRRGQKQTTLDGFSTGGRPAYGFRRKEISDPLGRTDRAGNPVIRVTVDIEPTEAAIIRRIFERYAKGAGYKKIVLGLNAEGIRSPSGGTWDVGAVREILRNPIYAGTRVYGRIKKIRTEKGTRSKRLISRAAWTVKPGAHPAIIAHELWESVQRKLGRVAEIYQRSGMAQAQLAHSQYLLSGILQCAACGGHFIARATYKTKAGVAHHYGCGWHARRGPQVCANRTHLPQAATERELMDVLLGTVLTPRTVERILDGLNARLRVYAAQAGPQLKEFKKALIQKEREIANYTQAIARGKFESVERALAAAENERATLKAELIRLEGAQPITIPQISAAALQQRLQALKERMRSGDAPKVREAIQETVGRILVGVDGSLTIEAKPDGILGRDTTIAPLGCRGTGTNVVRTGSTGTAYSDGVRTFRCICE